MSFFGNDVIGMFNAKMTYCPQQLYVIKKKLFIRTVSKIRYFYRKHRTLLINKQESLSFSATEHSIVLRIMRKIKEIGLLRNNLLKTISTVRIITS